MNKIYFDNTNIFVVENFLTESELKYFDEKIKNAKWDQPMILGKKEWTAWSYNFEKIDESVTATIIERIESLFTEKYKWNGSHVIQRIQIGDGLAEHDDNPIDQGNSVGIAIYINDNFDGGEIYYPNLGLINRPIRGSLICHPGNLEYTHGVKTVLKNDRYILASYGKLLVD